MIPPIGANETFKGLEMANLVVYRDHAFVLKMLVSRFLTFQKNSVFSNFEGFGSFLSLLIFIK